jgi:hypothetical protein
LPVLDAVGRRTPELCASNPPHTRVYSRSVRNCKLLSAAAHLALVGRSCRRGAVLDAHRALLSGCGGKRRPPRFGRLPKGQKNRVRQRGTVGRLVGRQSRRLASEPSRRCSPPFQTSELGSDPFSVFARRVRMVVTSCRSRLDWPVASFAWRMSLPMLSGWLNPKGSASSPNVALVKRRASQARMSRPGAAPARKGRGRRPVAISDRCEHVLDVPAHRRRVAERIAADATNYSAACNRDR